MFVIRTATSEIIVLLDERSARGVKECMSAGVQECMSAMNLIINVYF